MTTPVSRAEIEDFLYHEADLLDRWQLDAWVQLWATGKDVAYEVAPTGEDNTAELDPRTSMFLIADDRDRLEQRIIRMKKPSFHAEYVRSRVRHMYSNVRIEKESADGVDIAFNSAVFRTRGADTVSYPASTRMRLRKVGGEWRIVRKRIDLDLERLATMGALTILL
jgi:p-cumate 2,3-dioxygenase beta subunit